MNFFKEHKNLFFLKLFSVNSIGVLLRSVLGLVSQKLLAIYVGPEGIALVGNLRNALNIISLGSTSGIDQGLLTNQSKLENEPEKLKKLYSTSLTYSIIGSSIVGLVLLFGANFWSQYLFNTTRFNFLFIILGMTVPFTAIYNLCIAVINGKSDYKKATFMTFSINTVVTLLVICFVVNFGLSGALLALVVTPLVQFGALFVLARKEIKLFKAIKLYFDKAFQNELLIFIVMSFVAVVLSNVVDIQLRNHLISKLSIKEAGYWTSMMSLSNFYLAFMAGVYSLYILPKYAKIDSLNVFVHELKQIYKFVIPLFGILFVGLYLFREILIQLLFTKEFIPMQSLFKWQLIGDMIKIIAVIIGYQFIAQKLWRLFIITELVSFIVWYILGIYFIGKMGVEGIVFAHFLRYIVYLATVVISIYGYYKIKI